MEPNADPTSALAQRLRQLREQRWPDVRITQRRLANALGVSVPLISSWESAKAVPPVERLSAYATFFASRRSIAARPFVLVKDAELTDAERAERDRLQQDLLVLREAGRAASPAGPMTGLARRNPFHFADGHRVTIVCSQVPDEELRKRGVSAAEPGDPDYTEMYTYADLDALFELHGHIRAFNPSSDVNIRVADRLGPDRYTDHLVLLGGVDWNPATREFLRVLDIPVRQVERDDDPDGWFEVSDGQHQEFHPKLAGSKAGPGRALVEDVAHFLQAPNPFNHERTVTICNGMFSRGVLGAVRALTDARFRARNALHLRTRFRAGLISILSRVRVAQGVVVTPDWTQPGTVLHEWPVDGS